VPVSFMKAAPMMCCPVPVPAFASFSPPGLAFAAAITSCGLE
jgi:hypothetical protein